VIAVSIPATLGSPRHAAYAASKWGQVGFVESPAAELRGRGLTATCVLRASVDTDMLEGSGLLPAMSPDDVARTVAFVALEAPAAMNAGATEIFGP
jgi:NAD(P)-dependent dehydrogenase (short-subunit alcohol dehydrogenase family)